MRIELLLLLGALTATLAERGFMLTGPKSLMRNSVEKFCFDFRGVDAAANCTLDLLAASEEVVYASARQRFEGPSGCFSLLVPSVEEYSLRLRLQASFDGVDDYKINSSKTVWLQSQDPIHLIQTDKAWYTPGQLVRFRVLSLNKDLHPILAPVDRIWVENPSGTTVAQWTNAAAASGLHQMELQLAKEPDQGSWYIKMERKGDISSREFEVREFVLPKFEVVLKPPAFIRFNEPNETTTQKISFGICAKYSYGQPVKGTWRAAFEVESRRPFWWYRIRGRRTSVPYFPESNLEPVNFEKKGTLTDDCFTLKLSGDELGLQDNNSTYYLSKTINVVVTVKEQGTGIEANGTWSTRVEYESLRFDTSFHQPGFSYGLPYYGKLRVNTANGAPAPDVTVELCATPKFFTEEEEDAPYYYNRWTTTSRSTSKISNPNCTTSTSDDAGFISFQLFPTDTNIVSYEIKATVVDSKYPQDIDNPVQTSMAITATYSPSNSFLKFATPVNRPQATSCGSIVPLKMFFTAEDDVSFDLNYVVMSRGDVVLTGVKRVEFHKEDNIKFNLGDKVLNKLPGFSDAVTTSPLIGKVGFDLAIAPQFSPKVSVLAYYIRADGEVVTASTDIDIEDCFPNPVTLKWSSDRRQPGQNVTLNLAGAPGSVCGYSVVDKSVTFTRPDLQLSPSDIYKKLSNYHISRWGGLSQVVNDWEYCPRDREPFRRKRSESYGAEVVGETPTAETSGTGVTEGTSTPASTPTTESSSTDVTKVAFTGTTPEPILFHTYYNTQHRDAMDAFDDSGVMVMSDLKIQTRPCTKRRYRIRPVFAEAVGFAAPQAAPPVGAPAPAALPDAVSTTASSLKVTDSENDSPTSTVSVRTYFPETWLWDVATLDSRGELDLNLEMPHTVTTWVGSALCLSEKQGFGMSATSSVEAFQPFFLELHLPYSVKRAEKMQIKVSVFNYLSYDLPIRLTMGESKHFKLLGGSNSAQFCVPAKNSVVHQFGMYAVELGEHNVTVTATIDGQFGGACGPDTLPSGVDTVIKPLIVKPEGFPVERVKSRMVCPSEYEDDKTLTSNLTLPNDLVEGSARAWVTAVGDLMGPTLQGLSGLVRLPTGCGEQNMVLFTPNIFVVQYLDETKQLTEAISTKAVGFMNSGYQRQLKYRHADGSYSAFGDRDPSGSLWLTAFVVKSFAAARRYVHIDENDLQKSVGWLLSKQLENGCFPVVGTVLSKEMKGGAGGGDEDLSPLTAYTLVSLLEMYRSNSTETPKKLLEDTLPCLQVDDEEKRDLYTASLTAYALTLAGEMGKARKIVDWLLSKATRGSDGRTLWWEKPGSGKALNVELTSYVLLGLIKLRTPQDMLEASSIIRWLSRQRNSQGGFISTQDTVVALQGMSEYASLVGTSRVDMGIYVVAGDFVQSFRIKEEDRLVQRQIDLPQPLTSSVSIDAVDGSSGCAIVQTTLRYNVHTAPVSASFDLTLTTSPVEQGACGKQKLHVCSKYLLPDSSNMALVEIAMISGYEVDKSSLESLMKNSGVKRYEVKDDNVVLYFDEIQSKSQVCVDVVVDAAFRVEDAKESNVKIYDYYHTEYSKSVSYNLPSCG